MVRNIVGRAVIRSDSAALQDESMHRFELDPLRLFSLRIQQNFSPTFVTSLALVQQFPSP